MQRSFFQSHSVAGYYAKVTVEWSAPEGVDMDELDNHCMAEAEELAGELMAEAARKPYQIVCAMRGRSSR